MGHKFAEALSLVLAIFAFIALLLIAVRRFTTFFIYPSRQQNQRYVEHVARELNIGLCKHEHRTPMGSGTHAIFIVSLKTLLLCM